MAALALAMAACSNEDSALENAAPAQQPGTMHFTATIAAPSGDATTRTAYTEDGTTINVTWEVGDEIALVHNGVVDVAEVTAVDGSGNATIEATITGSPSDDDDVTLAYPADAVANATPSKSFPFTPNPTTFNKVKDQDGTLAYIQDNLDLRTGSGKLAVSGSDVTLKESVSIPNLICIWKLTLQDESSNALSATQLTFKNNDDTQAGTTSTGGKSEYYLCVVPSFIPDDEGTFSFEATVGSDTYTFSKTGLSLTAGKYYQSTVKMAKAVTARALAEATAGDIGKVVGADGKIYANVAAAKAASTTACAIIAYVGSATGESSPYTHGLAIAMKDAATGGSVIWSSSSKDEPQTNYTDVSQAVSTSQSGLSNTPTGSFYSGAEYPAFGAALHNTIDVTDGISAAAPAGTSVWFLPTLYQWNMIVKGLSGKTADLSSSENNDYKASSLNTKITAAGGTGLQSGHYWSSTEYDGYAAWCFNAYGGIVYNRLKESYSYYVRSAFAF